MVPLKLLSILSTLSTPPCSLYFFIKLGIIENIEIKWILNNISVIISVGNIFNCRTPQKESFLQGSQISSKLNSWINISSHCVLKLCIGCFNVRYIRYTVLDIWNFKSYNIRFNLWLHCFPSWRVPVKHFLPMFLIGEGGRYRVEKLP